MARALPDSATTVLGRSTTAPSHERLPWRSRSGCACTTPFTTLGMEPSITYGSVMLAFVLFV